MPELEEDYLVQIVRNGQNRSYSYQVPDHATILKTTNVKHHHRPHYTSGGVYKAANAKHATYKKYHLVKPLL